MDLRERKSMDKETLVVEGPKKSTKEEKTWEAVIEAVLFTKGNSVELKALASAIGQDEATAKEAVLRLMKRYDTGKRGMQILELENCYQMCTRSEYYENLIRVAAAPNKQVLTEVILETLSIIEYNLVYEVGRLDAPGRPALFATTEEFLRRFGIGSTQNLPVADPVVAAEIRMEVEEELSESSDLIPAGDKKVDDIEEEIR